MGHLLGYARVSTADQRLDLQIDALRQAGCYRVFQEAASGAVRARPALDQVLDQLRSGDTLVVWKLDRLGPSLTFFGLLTRQALRRGSFANLRIWSGRRDRAYIAAWNAGCHPFAWVKDPDQILVKAASRNQPAQPARPA